jgi:hypothetical protein
MPDKNVQLPDGRIVAFPDSMADADISAVIKKQLISAQPDRQHTLLNMTAAMSGQPQQTPEDQARFEAGKKAGATSAAETTGGVLGGEVTAGMRGVVGILARMGATGGGAATGNAAGQLGTTGTVNPGEVATTGAVWGGTSGVLEGLSAAIPALRGALSRLMYTGKVAADGTAELSKVGRSILHPTELPENALRAAVPPPPEATAAAAKQAGEANAAKLETQMKEAEAARQQTLTDKAKLEMQDATEQAAAVKRQQAAVKLAAKNAPEPSPFAGATSSSFNDLKIPTAPKLETDSLGIRWAVDENGLRVSIPKSVSDAEAGKYATAKLAEQKSILSDIKSRTAPAWNVQSGAKSPFTSTGLPPEAVGGDLTGQDLISRTKKIVQPGKAVTADDLKRAGDLTQVPLEKLKQLASWGDELAKNEIVRRLRQ